MDNLFEFLSNPSFWVVTVFFGILINIVSDWLRSPLERIIGRYRDDFRIKNEKSREEFEATIEELRNNPTLVVQLQLEIIYDLLVSILIPSIALFINDFLWSATMNDSGMAFYFLYVIRELLRESILSVVIYGTASVAFFIVLNAVRRKRNLYNLYRKRMHQSS